MKLGIVVTDKMHATAATCLIEDALARDWGVRCFLTDDGVLTKEIMPDLLHPKQAGYKLWAEAITPKLKEMLGE